MCVCLFVCLFLSPSRSVCLCIIMIMSMRMNFLKATAAAVDGKLPMSFSLPLYCLILGAILHFYISLLLLLLLYIDASAAAAVVVVIVPTSSHCCSCALLEYYYSGVDDISGTSMHRVFGFSSVCMCVQRCYYLWTFLLCAFDLRAIPMHIHTHYVSFG